MNIQQFKEFKSEFKFTSILDEYASLDKSRKNTHIPEVVKICNDIEKKLTHANRPKSDINNSILLSYVLYLCYFTHGMHSNFDKIYKWIKNDPTTYIDEVTLKETIYQ